MKMYYTVVLLANPLYTFPDFSERYAVLRNLEKNEGVQGVQGLYKSPLLYTFVHVFRFFIFQAREGVLSRCTHA